MSTPVPLIPKTRDEITVPWLNAIFAKHGTQVEVTSVKFLGDAKICGPFGVLSSLERLHLEFLGGNTMNIVLKTLPSDPSIRKYTVNAGFLTRETNMYKRAFKDVEKFLDSKNVSHEFRFRYPTCYYAAEEGEGDTYSFILVLEDMLATGYEIWNAGQTQDLDYERIIAVVREVALFHAGFITYGIHNNIKHFRNVYPFLLDATKDDPDFSGYIENGFKILEDKINADKDEITPSGLILHLRYLATVLPTMVKEIFGKQYPFPCISHNDLHTGNIFYTVNPSLPNSTKACLIDFQACVHDSPMFDLGYFLLSSCNFNDSWINVDRILEYYHTVLMEAVKATGVNFNYPLESIKKDYKESIRMKLMHIAVSSEIWNDGNKVSWNRFKKSLFEAYRSGLLDYTPKNNI